MNKFVFSIAVAIPLLMFAACNGTGSSTGGTSPVAAAPQFAEGQSAQSQVNAIRAKASRKPIQRSRRLDAAARAHVSDLVANGTYGHIGSDGSTPGRRATKAGFKWCTVTENLGEGSKYNSQSKIMAGWAGSPAHHKNIVNKNVSAFGMAQKNGIWVQILAGDNC